MTDDPWDDTTFSELVDLKFEKVRPSRMIRSGRWKLWQFVDDEHLPPALFDLGNDPQELHDVSAAPQHYGGAMQNLLTRLHEG